MPKKRLRAAGYARCSDENLHDSATLESQANAIREYCRRQGYELIETHMYTEAISAYYKDYTERPKMLELIQAAKRQEFDVVVCTEVRALSRQQVEVFVIYDVLMKCRVNFETIQEKFEDSAMGRYILASRAMISEVERENTFARCQRGRKDRIANGNLPGHPKASYGYTFVNTEREVKARYILNEIIVYVDKDGKEWTERDVVVFIFDCAMQKMPIRRIAITLNELGIPTPHKARKGVAFWQTASIFNILKNREYIGEAYANKTHSRAKKTVKVPLEEQLRLPDGVIPAIIDKAVFEAVQEQLVTNKQEALRNNKHPHDLGILRSGHVLCGICGRKLFVRYANANRRGRAHNYFCQGKMTEKHITSIVVHVLDKAVWERVVEIIQNPDVVRSHVEQLRTANKAKRNPKDVENILATIRRKMQNLYKLAEDANDNDTIDTLKGMLKQLEKQKHEAEAMLFDIEEDADERRLVESEIVRFEKWTEKVRPCITDPLYEPTYEEQRFAVRIIGIRVTLYPEKGNFPYRYKIEYAPPAIMALLTKYTVQQELRR